MSEQLQAMTEAEYLAWENRQETKHEFDGVRPVPMVGGTADHDRIRGNLHLELRLRLRGRSCEPFGPRVGDIWSIDVLRGDQALDLPEIGIGLPLAALYAGLPFPDLTP